jgi:hypothetical protein
MNIIPGNSNVCRRLCPLVGLLLERELTASLGIAVLERRRLEQVKQERSVTPDAETEVRLFVARHHSCQLYQTSR